MAGPATERSSAPGRRASGSTGRHPWPGLRAGGAGLSSLAVLGVGLRVWLLLTPLGYLNADEAQMSIQARELLRGHAWVLVPGTPYGGNVEAWLDAPLTALLGFSATRNKLEVGLLWLVAGLVLARSVRRLGRGPAAAAFGVVWLCSAALVLQSTLAYPGYSMGLLATCGLVALARPFLDDPPVPARGGGTARAARGEAARRAVLIGALGGLAVWQHPLYGWVCATTVAAVVWRQRRRLLAVLGPLVAGGALALSPVVVTNLRHNLATLRFRGPPTVPYPERVRAWLTDLYPRAIGAKWLDLGWFTGRIGKGEAILALVALVATSLAVLRWSPPSGKVAAGALLLAPLAMTLLGGNTAYTLDGRYAIMITPAAALVVAHGAALLPRGWTSGLRVPVAVAAWAVVAVVVPFATSTNVNGAGDAGLDRLVAFLDAHQVTAARADYWVAYRLIVRTDEHVVATPLDPIRFDRYEQEVRRAEAVGGAALVLDTVQAPAYLAATTPYDAAPLNAFSQYRTALRVEVARWTVFLPPGPPPGP